MKSNINFRLVTSEDLPDVEKIEFEAFAHPWTIDEFKAIMKQPNIIALVVIWDDKIIGFMLYQIMKDKYFILNMAIAKKFRRLTIGTQFIKKIKIRLRPDDRTKIIAIISENNVMAQLFFKKNEFLYTKTLPSGADNRSDAYLFEYSL